MLRDGDGIQSMEAENLQGQEATTAMVRYAKEGWTIDAGFVLLD